MKKPLIIITGASSGIGAGLARAFSAAGYPLGLLARNIAAMQALELTNCLCLATDVTDFIAVENAIKIAEEKFGPVDCLINNAGMAKGGTFTTLSHAEHETTIQTNIMGVVNGIEIVLPGMQCRKSGTIINISSVADRNARPNLPSYAASKAAIKSLSESLRVENAKYGIRICNVSPAKIKTPMLITSNLKEDEAIKVEHLANAVLWLYQQPQSVCIRDLVMAPTSYEP